MAQDDEQHRALLSGDMCGDVLKATFMWGPTLVLSRACSPLPPFGSVGGSGSAGPLWQLAGCSILSLSGGGLWAGVAVAAPFLHGSLWDALLVLRGPLLAASGRIQLLWGFRLSWIKIQAKQYLFNFDCWKRVSCEENVELNGVCRTQVLHVRLAFKDPLLSPFDRFELWWCCF